MEKHTIEVTPNGIRLLALMALFSVAFLVPRSALSGGSLLVLSLFLLSTIVSLLVCAHFVFYSDNCIVQFVKLPALPVYILYSWVYLNAVWLDTEWTDFVAAALFTVPALGALVLVQMRLVLWRQGRTTV